MADNFTLPAPDLAAHSRELFALLKAGRLADLENMARQLVSQFPDFGFGWKILGVALQSQGKDALLPMQKAAQLLPDDAQAHFNLATAASKAGLVDEAVAGYRRALALNPAYPEALLNLGTVLKDSGRLDEALSHYRRALSLKPNYHQAYANIGLVQHERGQLDEAAQSFRQALAINPGFIDTYIGFAALLRDMGRLEDAIFGYRRALEIDPASAKARFGLAIALLMSGKWQEGWEHYEHRWDGTVHAEKGWSDRPPTSLRQWNGEPTSAADRLLVFAEQGFGDSLQFARYLPLAAERFSRVSFVCPPPLARLFERSFAPSVDILAETPADQSAWNWQSPLLSLPRAFATRLENVPDRVPYLAADPQRVKAWQVRLDELGGGPKVGITWAGTRDFGNGAPRSLSQAQLGALLDQTAGVTWLSLQKGPDAAPPDGLVDWMDEIGDFAETAALICALDLVVSVDTSVAHLAGGLGRPTWLLNRFKSEWRWLRGPTDNAWYPTMRIFNQPAWGDWDSVVLQLAAALEEFG